MNPYWGGLAMGFAAGAWLSFVVQHIAALWERHLAFNAEAERGP